MLIEGDIDLFYYENKDFKYFYYRKNEGEIKLLLYKKYITLDDKVQKEDYTYISQIQKLLKSKCVGFDMIKDLGYSYNSMIDIFEKYYKCENLDYLIYKDEEEYLKIIGVANLGLGWSSLEIYRDFS